MWPRVQLQALRHSAKIILADFNLPVSILTAKLPNLIPRQIFRLYGMSCLHAQCVYNSSHVYIVKCTVIQARAPLASFPCANSVYHSSGGRGPGMRLGHHQPTRKEECMRRQLRQGRNNLLFSPVPMMMINSRKLR